MLTDSYNAKHSVAISCVNYRIPLRRYLVVYEAPAFLRDSLYTLIACILSFFHGLNIFESCHQLNRDNNPNSGARNEIQTSLCLRCR